MYFIQWAAWRSWCSAVLMLVNDGYCTHSSSYSFMSSSVLSSTTHTHIHTHTHTWHKPSTHTRQMYHKVLQVHTCALTKWKILNHEVVIPMTLIAGHSWDSYMFLMFKWCTSLCCSWVSTSYISMPFFHYYLILHYTVPLLFHLLRDILFHVQLDVWTSTDIYMNWNVFAWMLDLLGDPDLPCCFLSVSLLCSLCKHVACRRFLCEGHSVPL